jgi:hypothetical protein
MDFFAPPAPLAPLPPVAAADDDDAAAITAKEERRKAREARRVVKQARHEKRLAKAAAVKQNGDNKDVIPSKEVKTVVVVDDGEEEKTRPIPDTVVMPTLPPRVATPPTPAAIGGFSALLMFSRDALVDLAGEDEPEGSAPTESGSEDQKAACAPPSFFSKNTLKNKLPPLTKVDRLAMAKPIPDRGGLIWSTTEFPPNWKELVYYHGEAPAVLTAMAPFRPMMDINVPLDRAFMVAMCDHVENVRINAKVRNPLGCAVSFVAYARMENAKRFLLESPLGEGSEIDKSKSTELKVGIWLKTVLHRYYWCDSHLTATKLARGHSSNCCFATPGRRARPISIRSVRFKASPVRPLLNRLPIEPVHDMTVEMNVALIPGVRAALVVFNTVNVIAFTNNFYANLRVPGKPPGAARAALMKPNGVTLEAIRTALNECCDSFVTWFRCPCGENML